MLDALAASAPTSLPTPRADRRPAVPQAALARGRHRLRALPRRGLPSSRGSWAGTGARCSTRASGRRRRGRAAAAARARSPSATASIFYLGVALGRQGRWREALEVLEDCIARRRRQGQVPLRGRSRARAAGLRRLRPAARGPGALERAVPTRSRRARARGPRLALLPRAVRPAAEPGRERGGLRAGARRDRAAPAEAARADRAGEGLRAARSHPGGARGGPAGPRAQSGATTRQVQRSADLAARRAGEPDARAVTRRAATATTREALARTDAEWVVLDRRRPEGCDVRSLVGGSASVGRRHPPTPDGPAGRLAPLVPARSLHSAGVVPSADAALARRPQRTASSPSASRTSSAGCAAGSLSVARCCCSRSTGSGDSAAASTSCSRWRISTAASASSRSSWAPAGPTPASTARTTGCATSTSDRTPDDIVRLAIEERAVLVHVISGLAFDVTVSLQAFDIRVIQGVHSWRDMYTPTTTHDGYFPDIDRASSKRPEFDVVLQEAAAVYANADFSRARSSEATACARRSSLASGRRRGVGADAGGLRPARQHALREGLRSDPRRGGAAPGREVPRDLEPVEPPRRPRTPCASADYQRHDPRPRRRRRRRCTRRHASSLSRATASSRRSAAS